MSGRDVVLISTDDEVVTLLKLVLRIEGLHAADGVGLTSALEEIVEHIRKHDPLAVIIHVPYPYQANCETFRRLQDELLPARYSFVILTTCTRDVRQYLGVDNTVPIIEMPFGLDDFLKTMYATSCTAELAVGSVQGQG